MRTLKERFEDFNDIATRFFQLAESIAQPPQTYTHYGDNVNIYLSDGGYMSIQFIYEKDKYDWKYNITFGGFRDYGIRPKSIVLPLTNPNLELEIDTDIEYLQQEYERISQGETEKMKERFRIVKQEQIQKLEIQLERLRKEAS
jgi:hypothetical protein